jgi:hypothetical protein
MAIVEKRVCDIFGTPTNIRRHRIMILADGGDGEADGVEDHPEDAPWSEVFMLEADLSPRALERAKRFAERAFTSPRAGKDENDG